MEFVIDITGIFDRDGVEYAIGIDDVVQDEERIANAIADSVSPLLVPYFQFYTWRNRDF